MKMQWSVENFGVGEGGLESSGGGQRGVLPRGNLCLELGEQLWGLRGCFLVRMRWAWG